jgi:hypothetical protein
MHKLALVALAWIAVLVAQPAAARADAPVLFDHRFVPSSLVAWSFVDTQVSSTSEAGITDFVIRPELPLISNFVSVPTKVNGSYLQAAQTISASVEFANLVSVRIGLQASGILPRRTTSSLALGAHGAVGEGIGASLRIFGTDRFDITLRADFTWQQVESLIPERLPSSPRVNGNVYVVHPALAAALALSPRLGLQGSIAADYEHFDVAQTDSVVVPSGALAMTISLDPAPLTFLIGANVLHEFGRDVSSVTAQAVFGARSTDYNVEGGLYLMSRRELDLGLIFLAEVAGGDHNTREHGLFRLGYYF